ncbi:MAG: hypothetical protein COB67_05175 [SAR324 cluster bacterium]|uniref:Uncharacterized protein n=1 Tax=SAR324 cluster bacterium TaxID=2024889 RepID=A0A2A4T7L0_9DELT|nr:MAG: hypothetical protein COB67_05175 [SAR324 cluster bacterium]
MRIDKGLLQRFCLLAGVLILVAVNLILPLKDKIPYLEKRIDELWKEKKFLQGFVLQMEYHRPVYQGIQAKSKELSKPGGQSWENMLAGMLKQRVLHLVKQQVESLEPVEWVHQLRIQQEISGSYQEQMAYFNDLLRADNQMLIKSYQLKSQDYGSKSPTLIAIVELRYFFVKL